MGLDLRALLRIKRDGGALSREQIEGFFRGYVAEEIPEHFASALLMAIFLRGMEPEELVAWTRAMLESGEKLSFGRVRAPKLDKHSTGGIGDKVSIPLAPAVAACGGAVPMISGRGLGHTGGTLDKLESIPGFRTDLSAADFARCLERTGAALGAQTPELVPADRRLYALRDATGLIESIPLIASSILSKKLAEGLDGLVLDVKFGSGAFLPEIGRGRELGRVMVDLARGFGLRASFFQTNMSRPLGTKAGNALEIEESLDCLEGKGPADLRELVELFGAELLRLGGVVEDRQEGRSRIGKVLENGAALERFERVVAEQGGDARVVRDRKRLPRVETVEVWKAPASGVLAYRDLREVGEAICALGGGRRALGDEIDPAVGLVFLRSEGDEVRAGEELVAIHHRAGRGLEEAVARLALGVALGRFQERLPLVAPWSS
jgi:pyrimidine-nucleoside phosphorylase